MTIYQDCFKPQAIFLTFSSPMKNFLLRFRQDQSGQALTEYALILAVIAIAVVAVMTLLGDQITAVFNSILEALGGAADDGGDAGGDGADA